VVRVRLDTDSVVYLGSDSKLLLAAGATRREVGSGEVVRVSAAGVAVSGKVWCRLDDTVCAAGAGGLVRVGSRRYRGSLRLFRAEGRRPAVVNVVGLEEYLCGVVPCEIGPLDERTREAAKAQAVAARSFTLARLGRRKGLGHDLFDSHLRDQEYRGAGCETDLGSEAVRATAGEVLRLGGAVAEALYHGTCGGVTSAGSSDWLVSVEDAPRPGATAYCADATRSRWTASVSRDSLDRVASRAAGARRWVRSARLDAHRGSGRVRYVYLTTDKGELRLHGADFRSALGLSSQSFEVKLSAESVRVSGRGWGHGVGMCQSGALAMARAGSDYRQILRHYYPRGALGRAY
jgi:stage II sporulation protein D